MLLNRFTYRHLVPGQVDVIMSIKVPDGQLSTQDPMCNARPLEHARQLSVEVHTLQLAEQTVLVNHTDHTKRQGPRIHGLTASRTLAVNIQG